MYKNSASENDEFNRMQNKIKDTIESIVPNNHLCNTYNNLSSVKNNDSDDNKYF